MEWYIECLKKYAVFSGRARRKEFWIFALVNFVISSLLQTIFTRFMGNPQLGAVVSGLYSLAVLLPGFGVFVRRMHDTGRTGWWWLIVFIPIIGALVLLVFCCLEGDRGDNQYGPDPRQA